MCVTSLKAMRAEEEIAILYRPDRFLLFSNQRTLIAASSTPQSSVFTPHMRVLLAFLTSRRGKYWSKELSPQRGAKTGYYKT